VHMVVTPGIEPSHRAYETQARTIWITVNSTFSCTAVVVHYSGIPALWCNRTPYLPPYCNSACENRVNLFPYLWDFSAFASILQAAHSSLFKVVTRSLVPLIHFGKIDMIASFPV